MSTLESKKTIEWQQKNPDKYKAKQANWRKRNREYVNANHKRWRLLNPEKEKAIYTKRNHKFESLEYRRLWKSDHKEEYKEKRFLKEFLSSDSCCLICGELNPFMLEEHHPFGRRNSFKITLCSNHHSVNHRFKKLLEANWIEWKRTRTPAT